MQNPKTRVHRFLVSEDGPTAVEYAVMLALILVACITIVTSLGTRQRHLQQGQRLAGASTAGSNDRRVG